MTKFGKIPKISPKNPRRSPRRASNSGGGGIFKKISHGGILSTSLAMSG